MLRASVGKTRMGHAPALKTKCPTFVKKPLPKRHFVDQLCLRKPKADSISFSRPIASTIPVFQSSVALVGAPAINETTSGM